MAFRKYDYTFDVFFQPVRPVLYCSKKNILATKTANYWLVQNKTLEFYKGIALHHLTK